MAVSSLDIFLMKQGVSAEQYDKKKVEIIQQSKEANQEMWGKFKIWHRDRVGILPEDLDSKPADQVAYNLDRYLNQRENSEELVSVEYWNDFVGEEPVEVEKIERLRILKEKARDAALRRVQRELAKEAMEEDPIPDPIPEPTPEPTPQELAEIERRKEEMADIFRETIVEWMNGRPAEEAGGYETNTYILKEIAKSQKMSVEEWANSLTRAELATLVVRASMEDGGVDELRSKITADIQDGGILIRPSENLNKWDETLYLKYHKGSVLDKAIDKYDEHRLSDYDYDNYTVSYDMGDKGLQIEKYHPQTNILMKSGVSLRIRGRTDKNDLENIIQIDNLESRETRVVLSNVSVGRELSAKDVEMSNSSANMVALTGDAASIVGDEYSVSELKILGKSAGVNLIYNSKIARISSESGDADVEIQSASGSEVGAVQNVGNCATNASWCFFENVGTLKLTEKNLTVLSTGLLNTVGEPPSQIIGLQENYEEILSRFDPEEIQLSSHDTEAGALFQYKRGDTGPFRVVLPNGEEEDFVLLPVMIEEQLRTAIFTMNKGFSNSIVFQQREAVPVNGLEVSVTCNHKLICSEVLVPEQQTPVDQLGIAQLLENAPTEMRNISEATAKDHIFSRLPDNASNLRKIISSQRAQKYERENVKAITDEQFAAMVDSLRSNSQQIGVSSSQILIHPENQGVVVKIEEGDQYDNALSAGLKPLEHFVLNEAREALKKAGMDPDVLPRPIDTALTDEGKRIFMMSRVDGRPRFKKEGKKNEDYNYWQYYQYDIREELEIFQKHLRFIAETFPVFEAAGIQPAYDFKPDELLYSEADGKVRMVDFDIKFPVGEGNNYDLRVKEAYGKMYTWFLDTFDRATKFNNNGPIKEYNREGEFISSLVQGGLSEEKAKDIFNILNNARKDGEVAKKDDTHSEAMRVANQIQELLSEVGPAPEPISQTTTAINNLIRRFGVPDEETGHFATSLGSTDKNAEIKRILQGLSSKKIDLKPGEISLKGALDMAESFHIEYEKGIDGKQPTISIAMKLHDDRQGKDRRVVFGVGGIYAEATQIAEIDRFDRDGVQIFTHVSGGKVSAMVGGNNMSNIRNGDRGPHYNVYWGTEKGVVEKDCGFGNHVGRVPIEGAENHIYHVKSTFDGAEVYYVYGIVGGESKIIATTSQKPGRNFMIRQNGKLIWSSSEGSSSVQEQYLFSLEHEQIVKNKLPYPKDVEMERIEDRGDGFLEIYGKKMDIQLPNERDGALRGRHFLIKDGEYLGELDPSIVFPKGATIERTKNGIVCKSKNGQKLFDAHFGPLPKTGEKILLRDINLEKEHLDFDAGVSILADIIREGGIELDESASEVHPAVLATALVADLDSYESTGVQVLEYFSGMQGLQKRYLNYSKFLPALEKVIGNTKSKVQASEISEEKKLVFLSELGEMEGFFSEFIREKAVRKEFEPTPESLGKDPTINIRTNIEKPEEIEIPEEYGAKFYDFKNYKRVADTGTVIEYLPTAGDIYGMRVEADDFTVLGGINGTQTSLMMSQFFSPEYGNSGMKSFGIMYADGSKLIEFDSVDYRTSPKALGKTLRMVHDTAKKLSDSGEKVRLYTRVEHVDILPGQSKEWMENSYVSPAALVAIDRQKYKAAIMNGFKFVKKLYENGEWLGDTHNDPFLIGTDGSLRVMDLNGYHPISGTAADRYYQDAYNEFMESGETIMERRPEFRGADTVPLKDVYEMFDTIFFHRFVAKSQNQELIELYAQLKDENEREKIQMTVPQILEKFIGLLGDIDS